MLERIRIKGYRALKDVTIDVTPGVPVVLIGENASGKSTLLDALAVLGRIAEGHGGDAITSRGGWQAVTWRGSGADIEITVTFGEASFKEDRGPVEYWVRLGGERQRPTVVDEEVRVYKRGPKAKPLCVLKGGANPWALNRHTEAREPVGPSNADWTFVTNSVLANIVDQDRYPTCVRLRGVLARLAFYPPLGGFRRVHDGDAGRDRGDGLGARPVERVPRVGPDGRNLLGALHTLATEHPHAWAALQADLRAVFPWCESIRFPPGPGRGLLSLAWTDSRSKADLYLDDMSEGMLVYLSLLAALHAQDEPALLAFDEPERSLHPHALRRLAKVMESRAESTPVLVATHSDRFLDFLEEPAQALRVMRFRGEAGVTLEALDKELLDAWLAEYTLSELRARDMLEDVEEDEP